MRKKRKLVGPELPYAMGVSISHSGFPSPNAVVETEIVGLNDFRTYYAFRALVRDNPVKQWVYVHFNREGDVKFQVQYGPTPLCGLDVAKLCKVLIDLQNDTQLMMTIDAIDIIRDPERN